MSQKKDPILYEIAYRLNWFIERIRALMVFLISDRGLTALGKVMKINSFTAYLKL